MGMNLENFMLSEIGSHESMAGMISLHDVLEQAKLVVRAKENTAQRVVHGYCVF